MAWEKQETLNLYFVVLFTFVKEMREKQGGGGDKVTCLEKKSLNFVFNALRMLVNLAAQLWDSSKELLLLFLFNEIKPL